MSTADVKPRKTAKSKLQEVLLKEGDSTIVDNLREVAVESRHNSTNILDLMAALRSMVQIPENYEDLTWKMFSSCPKGFQRVDIVTDTYRNVSIKTGERKIRGRSDKVIIKSTKSTQGTCPRYQKILRLSYEMVKIRTGS